MKLLMITGDRSLVEGRRGAFYNTLEEFHKHWDRVDIICPRIKSQISSQFGNVFIHPSLWPLWLQPFWILKKGRQIYRDQNYNLFTVHEYVPFYNGLGAKMLRHFVKAPYILEIMHVPGLPRAASFKENIYKFLTKIFISFDVKTAMAVRVINKVQIPDFLVNAGVPKDKIKYIPANYIDFSIFKSYPEVQKKYDLVFAARLEKNKGTDLLIDAVNKLKNKIPDVGLLIIGGGPLKESLRTKVKRLKLGNNIFFSGWLPEPIDVAKAYNEAKIFINPSLNEGGPRVALEAMACGVPVVTTHVGIMEDIVQDGENGLFTDWDPKNMAETIFSLLKDEDRQIKISKAGLETVKKFEKISAIKNYADSLKNLIHGK